MSNNTGKIILSRVLVAIDGVWIGGWIYCTLHIHTTRDYRQYSANADLHNLKFYVTYTLWFSVFTSRILATDIQQQHCHFKSLIKSSPPNFFLAIILQLPTQFNPSAPKLISRQAGVPKLDSTRLRLYTTEHFLITTLHGPPRKHSLNCLAMDVLLLRALVPAGMCLPSRCLATGLCITIS
jgi:hypothetical protein